MRISDNTLPLALFVAGLGIASAFAFDGLSASAIRFGDDIDTDLHLVGLEFLGAVEFR